MINKNKFNKEKFKKPLVLQCRLCIDPPAQLHLPDPLPAVCHLIEQLLGGQPLQLQEEHSKSVLV